MVSFPERLRTPNRRNQEVLPLVSPPFSEDPKSSVCWFLPCVRAHWGRSLMPLSQFKHLSSQHQATRSTNSSNSKSTP